MTSACRYQDAGGRSTAPEIDFCTPQLLDGIRGLLNRTSYARRVFELLASPRQWVAGRKEPCSSEPAPAEVDLLVDLFFQAHPVAANLLERILAPLSLEHWEQAGLLRREGEMVVPLVALTPYKGLILASDPEPSYVHSVPPGDYVPAPNQDSLWLAALTIRRASRRTLDLGAGCGLQSLLAASHSDRVLALDINPRALAFCRLNARLNGISNITFASGDLFRPLAETRFDLIVSQAAPLIGLDQHGAGREHPVPADGFLRRLVGEVPRYLNRGGYAQIVGDWSQFYGEDWRQRLAGWVDIGVCDSWAIERESRSPGEYVENRLNGGDRREFEARFTQWVSYYRQINVEALISGILNLRRSETAPGWFHSSSAPRRLFPDAGRDIERGFMLQDYLLRHVEEQALLNSSFRVLPYVRLEQHSGSGQDNGLAAGVQLVRTRGIPLAVPINRSIARILLRCNGDSSLGQLLHDLAVRQGVEFEQLVRRTVEPLRQLVADGFLIPLSLGLDDDEGDATNPQYSGLDAMYGRGEPINLADTLEPFGEGDPYCKGMDERCNEVEGTKNESGPLTDRRRHGDRRD